MRRILITLDSSGGSLEAVDGAALMASRLGAELVGLFVEDANLVRLAALPCSAEVGFASGRARRLNPGTVKRGFEHLAEDARCAIARAADGAQVKWSFEVKQGTVVAEALRAIGRDPVHGRAHAAMACDPAGSVVLLQAKECTAPAGDALIVLDAGHRSLRAFPTALELAAQSCTVGLQVVVVSDSVIAVRAQIARVRRLLESDDRPAVAVHAVTAASVQEGSLPALAENLKCGALVFSACAGLLDADALAALVEAAEYPVFVVA